MRKLFFLLISVPLVSFAQESYNPFASIGKKANVVTLSNGRYKEMYGGDTIKRIGTVLFDVRTNKIVKFLDEGDTTIYLSKNEGDLSTRWLSIDPLAAKYPYLTPYQFVNNTPILYIDSDGRDWEVHATKSNNGKSLQIKIVLNVAIYNSSHNQSYDPIAFQTAIAKQTEAIFKLSKTAYNKDGISDITVESQVNIRTIVDKKYRQSNEHLVEVLDDNAAQFSKHKKSVVGEALNGLDIVIKESQVANIISGKNSKTIPHEFGHTAGLKHPIDDVTSFLGIFNVEGETFHLDKSVSNFMKQGSVPNASIDISQISRMVKLQQSGQLNSTQGERPINKETPNQPIKAD